MQSLEQHITTNISSSALLQVKTVIEDNLNPKFVLRPYQKEAFARFDFVFNTKKEKPTQLLFHMATGSGKTLVMAGLMLDLYSKGYRNFIFFVHSTSIIEKTKDNFLNPASSKYLFADKLHYNNSIIEIKAVQNFENSDSEAINIVFTSIQGLHAQLNTPRENALTYEDFKDTKMVLLSDEAHHINAETKKGKQNKTELENQESWEKTVNRIFNTNKENLLLEFTATADLKHPEIAKKYYDKLIFDYPLKQFRKDLYSKEVKVLQSNLKTFDRALQALILSQYRHKIFEKNRLNIKPVILFKSKSIAESQVFYKSFVSGLKQLKPKQITQFITTNKTSIFHKVFEFLKKEKISIENFIIELQEDFSEYKCIEINSKNDSIEKQLIINSLEDITNEYRAVFAVDKLNEGWDVLNLFDIVRLYDSKHASSKKVISSTTMSEAQLIGRGARYCPFQTNDKQTIYQRKFDQNTEHELRIGEELYYHASHNPNYITELHRALLKTGIMAPKSEKAKTKNTITNRTKKTNKISDGLNKTIREKLYKVRLTSETSVDNLFTQETPKSKKTKYNLHIKIQDIPVPIIRKALNILDFYRFENLQQHFPKLGSRTEFINSKKYCGGLTISVSTDRKVELNELNNAQQLEIASLVLTELAQVIEKKNKF